MKNYVVLIGNPIDGMGIFGIFNNVEEAVEWCEKNVPNETWLVTELQPINK